MNDLNLLRQSENIDQQYEIDSQNEMIKDKIKKRNMLFLIILLAVVFLAVIINNRNGNGKDRETKHLINIIIDVSESLKESYAKMNLTKNEFNYNSLLKNLEFYSYFDRADVITNLIGTKQGKYYDLIGLLIELDSIINENDIQEKINDFENQKIYKRYDKQYLDTTLKNEFIREIPKIEDILKSFSYRKKCVLYHYIIKYQNKDVKNRVISNF